MDGVWLDAVLGDEKQVRIIKFEIDLIFLTTKQFLFTGSEIFLRVGRRC